MQCILVKSDEFPFIYSSIILIMLLLARSTAIILLQLLPVFIILLNPLPVLVVLKILREIVLFTRLLVINIRQLIRCLENSDPKSKTILCLPWNASRRLLYCAVVLQRDSRFVSRNCRATLIALTERPGSNGFSIIFSDKFGL